MRKRILIVDDENIVDILKFNQIKNHLILWFMTETALAIGSAKAGPYSAGRYASRNGWIYRLQEAQTDYADTDFNVDSQRRRGR